MLVTDRVHKALLALPYVYLLRVPLLLAVALLAIPPLARTGLRNVLGNLFVLHPGGLFFVSFAAILAGVTVVVTARVILLHGPARFGVTTLGTSKEISAWQPVFALWLGWWIVGFALWGSIEGIPPGEGNLYAQAVLLVLAALGGTVVAALVVGLVEILRFLWAEPEPERAHAAIVSARSSLPDLVVPARFVPNAIHRKKPPARLSWASPAVGDSRNLRERAPGYIDPQTGQLLPGHVFALVVLAALVFVYALGFVLDYPRVERGSKVPALVYLLALLTLPTWALAGAAFFLDRHRIPVVVVPAFLLGLSLLWPTDHFFETRLRPATPVASLGAQPADLVRRLDGCRLTAVAASGGGIRAAGWTAQVLTGLHHVPDFTPSLRILSTVSGGSVGAMYFVGAFRGPSGPPATALDSIVDLSMRSSLNDVAWGFAYPDLWRTFTPVVWSSATDRGWALEQAWKRQWPSRDDTLRTWRDDAASRRRPAVAFNATVVETGQRLALGTFDSPPSMQTLTFEDHYRERDIGVVTAARLSATFTYVTPVARARPDEPTKWHIADGGYQDNYGVATLVDWLDAALIDSESAAEPVDEAGQSCRDRLRVAVVRIGAHEAEGKAANRSWAFQLGAPVQVLLAIRTAGPRARNDMELELLTQAGLGPRLGVVCFDYANEDSPLSWHLSDAQRRHIQMAWRDVKNRNKVKALDDFLHARSPVLDGCS
jgi:hypothetical protein